MNRFSESFFGKTILYGILLGFILLIIFFAMVQKTTNTALQIQRSIVIPTSLRGGIFLLVE